MDFMKTIISAIKHWANNRFTVDSTLSTVAKTGRYEDMEGLIDETSIPNSIARIEAGQYSVTATSTNGWLYIATVPHIKELTTGVSFIMIPEITSTSKNPVLNINNFGQIGIKRNLSWSNANYYEGPFTSWLYAGRPVRLIYNGTCWIAESLSKPDVRDIEGTLSIDHGGTGGTTVANARNNLKVYSKTEVDTLINDLSEEVLQSLTDKVDKIPGKVLSSNDFTNEYKSKLDNLESLDFSMEGITHIGDDIPPSDDYVLWVDTNEESGAVMRADAIKYSTFNIDSASWSAEAPFTYTMPLVGITESTAIVNLTLDTNSQKLQKSPLEWETKANEIVLSTQTKPTGNLVGYLITAEAVTI